MSPPGGAAPTLPQFPHRPHHADIGDIQVTLRDLQLGVAEQHLNLTDVEAVFQPAGGALVPQVAAGTC